MRKIITLLSLLFIGNAALAQDISVIAITAPVSGCSLSATSSVTVNVKNVGLTDLSGVSFNLSYTINAGAPVTDLGVSFPFFAPNTTVSYTFTTTANLSTPGSYTFTAYSTYAPDINTTNDAFTGYVVTSAAPSVGGTVSGGTNVCNGANSGVLTLSGHTGSVASWEYSTDGGSTWISISNTTTTQSYLNLTVATKYRVQVQNGVCPSATSSIASMTIDPTTVPGTVSGTTTVCSGANAGNVTSSGRTGAILKWQSSIDGGVTWTDIASTATTQSYLNLTQTTRYRCQVQSGACSTGFSTQATITVNPPSVGGTVSGGTTVCSGANSGNLTLSGHTGAVTRWEFSTNGGVSWTNIANTTTTQSYLNLTATRWFRAFVTSSGCALGQYSTPDSIVVNPVSVGGTISSAATVCSGANGATLTLSGNTGAVQYWEYSTNGGLTYTNIANTTTSQAYLNLTQTTIYRANVKSGACSAVNSSTVTITVSPVSVGGSLVMNDTVCSGSNGGTITLSGQNGSITNWQSSLDGITWSNIANTTASQVYSNLVNTTYYMAVVKSGACPADSSGIDTITVNTPSIGGVVDTSRHICYNSNTGTLVLTGETGSIIRWESSIDGGINWVAIANTTNSYIYLNLTLTTQFRAVIQNGACPVAYSTPAVLTIDPTSVGGTINGSTTACGGSNSGSLDVIGYVGTIQGWESSTDGGLTWTPTGNTTATENYLNVVTTTMYHVIVMSGVCSKDTSSVATITVDPPSVGGVLSMDDTVCASGNFGTLTVAGYTGNIVQWESSSDGGITWIALANTTASQSYMNLTTTTSYRVNVKSGVCNATTSNIVTITVDPVAMGGTVNGTATVCDTINSGTLTLTGSAGNIVQWESSTDAGMTWTPIVNTTTTQSYTNLTDTTWFRVIISSGLCGNDTSTTATIYVNPQTVAGMVTISDTVCSGMNGDTLHLVGYTGTVLRWESSVDGGFTWIPISNTTDSLAYNNLSITTMYRAVVQSGICNPMASTPDTITVNPVSNAGMISGAMPGCESNNSGTLTVTGYTGAITDWESSTDGGATWTTLANTTAMQTWMNLPDTTWYRVIVMSGVCSADTSASVAVIIYPKPVAMFTADTVCDGNATLFTNASTIPSGFIQFSQWDFGDGNNSLSVNPTHTYGASGTFNATLTLTSDKGCLDTAAVSVIVNALPPSTITASGPLTFCSGDSVMLSAAAGGYDYIWSTADSTMSITVMTAGTYAMTISDTLTGCMAMDSVSVIVYPNPSVSAGADASLSLGSSVQLNGSGTGIISWSWFPVTGLTDSFIANPMASPTATTMYTLTGTDANGCMDKDSMTVTVLVDYNVVISNLMTPNEDGFNDRWIVQNIENYPDTKVIIVNREGQEVYSSDSYDNNWDGTNSKTGKKLPDGTYYYVMQFKDDVKIYKGAITVLSENSK
ncbi:MAG: gliding motility-associated C-terminal domain-containing protein [Bacteroidia bacterium]